MKSRFPHLTDATAFPRNDGTPYSQYPNDFEYERWGVGTKITVCRVPWDRDRNVVDWKTDEEIVEYFHSLDSASSFKLESEMNREPDGSIRLPVPISNLKKYNYLFVEYTTPTSNEQPLDYAQGERQPFIGFFMRDFRYVAPSTTEAQLDTDWWTTSITSLSVQNLMLERGHAPMAASPLQPYLDDPIHHTSYLLAPEQHSTSTSLTASSRWIPWTGEAGSLVVVALKSTLAQLKSVVEGSTRTAGAWTDPTFSPAKADTFGTRKTEKKEGNKSFQTVPDGEGPQGQTLYKNEETTIKKQITVDLVTNPIDRGKDPEGHVGAYGWGDRIESPETPVLPWETSQTPDRVLVAMENDDFRGLVEYCNETAPTAFDLIDSIFLLPKEAVSFKGNAVEIHGFQAREIQPVGEMPEVELGLSKESFGFPEAYSEITKLYTHPYSRIEVSDGERTAEIKIEETDGLKLHRKVSLVTPYLRASIFLSGIGSGESLSYRWLDLSGGEQTTQIPAGDWRATLFSFDIPTYALTVSGFSSWLAHDGSRSLEAQRTAAITGYENAVRSLNTSYESAMDSANLSRQTAIMAADQSNENSWNQAELASYQTARSLTAGALTTGASAATSKTNTINSTETGRTNSINSTNTGESNTLRGNATGYQNALASNATSKTNADAAADTAVAQTALSVEASKETVQAQNDNADAMNAAGDENLMANTNQENARLRTILDNTSSIMDQDAQFSVDFQKDMYDLGLDQAMLDQNVANALSVGSMALGLVAAPLTGGASAIAGAAASAVAQGATMAISNVQSGASLFTKKEQVLRNITYTFDKENLQILNNTQNTELSIDSNITNAQNLQVYNDLVTSHAKELNSRASQISQDLQTAQTANSSALAKANATRNKDTADANAARSKATADQNANDSATTARANTNRTADTANANTNRSYATTLSNLQTQNTTAKDTSNFAIETSRHISRRNNEVSRLSAEEGCYVAQKNASWSRATAVENAKKRLRQTQLAAKLSYQNHMTDSPVSVGTASGDPSQDALGQRGIQVSIKTLGQGEIRAAGDDFLRYGYRLDQAWTWTGWSVMKHFSYWQCKDVWLTPSSAFAELGKDAVRGIIEQGVTVWRRPEEIGTIPVTENWED